MGTGLESELNSENQGILNNICISYFLNNKYNNNNNFYYLNIILIRNNSSNNI